MALSQDDVARIAHLARLTLTPEEAKRFGGQLEAILEHVAALDGLDLKGVEPTTHAQNLANRFREDRVTPGLTPADVEANAPEFKAGAVRVPRIMEE